ncbi:hypothetical protein BX616_001800 [Lobosporangium transversale]|uniref:Uncharacterized protein n=1 Tax=Lobosporangium transversale TaxID=64571 RepID=A0A1Y2GWZ5_9FUNG|nr:hypothetical protein BCR41DRAFT_419775 [Lobosporangium transversale]KAF9902831.1 hypothetical protein BX616_001800 [Lobosporangium transversale]ORZ26818.1 hypothetical protein BCR41DRAFT_419775 [Lobosporangium transversale]|eukprot:XP_021884581.1 hypothetical protein BCR41DRAFT_419775 [Lobosporangium transversale]
MVVHPRLVGVLLRGRSNWKAVVETDIFVLQHHPRQENNPYRIITRGFPHYRVAEGDSIELLKEELDHLSQSARVVIQGKITSKKIVTWLKGTSTPNALSPPDIDLLNQEQDDDDEEFHDEDGYLSGSDLSMFSDEEDTPITDSFKLGVAGRLLRKAISLEDVKKRSSTTKPHRHSHQHQRSRHQHSTLLTNDLPERPGSSASASFLSVPSGSLPSSSTAATSHQFQYHQRMQQQQRLQQQQLQQSQSRSHPQNRSQHQYSLKPPYELDYLHKDYHRPSTMSQQRQQEDNYTLYTLDPVDRHQHQQHGDQSIYPNSNQHTTTWTQSPDKEDVQMFPFLNLGRRSNGGSRDSDSFHRSTHDGGVFEPPVATVPSDKDEQQQQQQHQQQQQANGDGSTRNTSGSFGWSSAPLILNTIISWIEGPPGLLAVAGAGGANSNGSGGGPNTGTKKSEKPNSILEIPLQFIALLTYPEPDPRNGNKVTLAMVRETAFVKQRRKTLLMLTAYTLLVRYCSFDFFLVLLFASNCGMLFLMKNSGRMNVNMAKRAVNQRVGWAKQWAGGIFRRGGGGGGGTPGISNTNNHVNNGGTNHHQQNNSINTNTNGDVTAMQQQQEQQQCGMSYFSASATSSKSTSMLSSTLATGSGTGSGPAGGDKSESAQEESPQQFIKRYGLFGKRKALNMINSAPTTPSGGIPAPTVPSTLSAILGSSSLSSDGATVARGAGVVVGDDASIMTGRTQRRGFFKRNATPTALASTLTLASRSATAPPAAIATAMSGPSTGTGTTLPSKPPAIVLGSASSFHSSIFTSRLVGGSSSNSPTIVPTSTSALTPVTNVLQSQLQSLPPRSPSPNTVRRDFSWSRPWSSTPLPPSLAPMPTPTAALLQKQLVDSPLSDSTWESPSPKSMPVVTSDSTPATAAAAVTAPASPLQQTQTQTQTQTNRSIVSINPRLFLPGFSLKQQNQQHQKQQQPERQQLLATTPLTKLMTATMTTEPARDTDTAVATTTATVTFATSSSMEEGATTPISPQPLNVTILSSPTSILHEREGGEENEPDQLGLMTPNESGDDIMFHERIHGIQRRRDGRVEGEGVGVESTEDEVVEAAVDVEMLGHVISTDSSRYLSRYMSSPETLSLPSMPSCQQRSQSQSQLQSKEETLLGLDHTSRSTAVTEPEIEGLLLLDREA